MSLENHTPDVMLEELRSSQSREAWAEFLRQYSSLIFQTCQFSTSDADQAAIASCLPASSSAATTFAGCYGSDRRELPASHRKQRKKTEGSKAV
jgi:hypothetical protein